MGILIRKARKKNCHQFKDLKMKILTPKSLLLNFLIAFCLLPSAFCLLPFAFCLLPSAFCHSQDFNPPEPEKENEKKPFWSWDRVYGGGGLGFWANSRSTFVNIAPQVGYKITKKYSAGIGITYTFIQDRTFSPPLSINIYGGSIFNRYLFTDFLFVHAEYEILNGPWDFFYDRRFTLYNVWLGGGLRQRIGNSSLNLMGLWNMNENIYSRAYFPSPQIRIGVNIGI